MKQARFFLLATALVCLASPVFAGPPYNVDDPGTLEPGRYNFTAAFISSQSSGKETQSFPNLTLKYGLKDATQISLGFGGISKRTAAAGRETGFADTTLGIKWRFKNETKTDPQWALGYQIKMPTANKSMGLGTGNFDHRLWLTFGKSFQRLKFFGNVGYNFLGDAKGTNNIYYGLATTFQATEHLIVGAQVYGNAPNARGKNDELAWGVGLRYNYAPDRALMLQVGRSERGFSDLNVYAGVSINFK
jgi:hypothetical protein